MQGVKIGQMIGGWIDRQLGRVVAPRGHVEHDISFNNPFVAQVWRPRKSGKMRLVQEAHGHNGVTVLGKNHMLDRTFGTPTTTAVDPWYIGLINNTPTPALDEADTLASHSGWTEWTSYTGNRKAWTPVAAASKVKGTGTVSTFTQSATGTLYGILVCAVASGTSGILWSTGAFDTTLNVISADDVKVTYGVRT